MTLVHCETRIDCLWLIAGLFLDASVFFDWIFLPFLQYEGTLLFDRANIFL